MKQFPESELDVLTALWKADAPVSRQYLEQQLKEKNWARNTINTYLSRLVQKGAVLCEKRGNTNYYWAAIAEAEYKTFVSKATLHKLYHNSVSDFVMSFCDGASLSNQEIDELQKLLDRFKGGST